MRQKALLNVWIYVKCLNQSSVTEIIKLVNCKFSLIIITNKITCSLKVQVTYDKLKLVPWLYYDDGSLTQIPVVTAK